MSQPATLPPLQGYQRKPAAIVWITLLFLLMPGAVLVQAWVMSDRSWSVVAAVLASRYFLTEWWLSWSAAAAVFLVSRWSFVYLLGLSVYALSTKLPHLVTAPHAETPVSLLMTGCWLSLVIVIMGSSLKAPYLNPQLRWWMRPARVALCREAALLYHGMEIPATVLNLSRGGAFLRLEESVAQRHGFPRQLGERVAIRMVLTPSGQPTQPSVVFEADARLVWKAKPESPYRYGMGMQFLHLRPEQTRSLTRCLRHEAQRRCAPAR